MRSALFLGLTFSIAVAGCSSGSSPASDGPRKDPQARLKQIRESEAKVSEEGLARRKRSIAILKAESVPVLESLPLTVPEAESTRRTTEQVAMRAMALCVVAVKGEGLEQEVVDRLIKDFQLESAFTPKEKAFIKDPRPTQHDRAQFAWRYECYWVMLWALGFADKLERPEKICDVGPAVAILRDLKRDGFLKKAKLRPQSEILDAADLIYRYHWAAVEVRLDRRKAPDWLNGEIVMERHYALNWLIGHFDDEWDDVSVDT